MSKPDFPRVVRCEDDGIDIDGHKAAMHRYLADGQLGAHRKKPKAVRQHAGCNPGDGWLPLLNKAQAKAQQPVRRDFDERLYKALWSARAYDAAAENCLHRYNMAHPALTICFPFPSNINTAVGGLHETAGLPGNWALDFICAPGAPVLAVEKGTIWRLSGRDPDDDSADAEGVYGWSVRYKTPAGYDYFLTHMGRRETGQHVGQIVQVGDVLGFVGDQSFRPDHLHLGVTSPLGETDAKRRILAVKAAPRLTL